MARKFDLWPGKISWAKDTKEDDQTIDNRIGMPGAPAAIRTLPNGNNIKITGLIHSTNGITLMILIKLLPVSAYKFNRARQTFSATQRFSQLSTFQSNNYYEKI